MARVISRFDLIALQEVMHPSAAKHLARIETKVTGEPWGVLTSHVEGPTTYKEGYAFLWRKSAVEYEGGATLYLDPGDHFVREPYSAQFKARTPAGSPTFVVGTVHIKYGDNEADRAPEIEALAAYWRWLGQNFANEPRLLMGDFNTPPDNPAWQSLKRLARPLITAGASTLSTRPGAYAHLYDNIWTSGGLHITSAGIGRYPEWLGISHKRAYVHISDHAPVYIGVDGAQITTARFNGVKSSSIVQGQASVQCINLNTASASQLDLLEHVGPSRAQAIINGRPWHSLADLSRIRGLDANRVKDIRQQHLTCMH